MAANLKKIGPFQKQSIYKSSLRSKSIAGQNSTRAQFLKLEDCHLIGMLASYISYQEEAQSGVIALLQAKVNIFTRILVSIVRSYDSYQAPADLAVVPSGPF